jgi:hypothetical protein
MDYWFLSPFMIPIVAIVSGCVVAIVKTISRNEVRALEIRERIAMIERGLVPPPETDPGGFERAMKRYDLQAPSQRGSFRHRRVGIIFMGVGFGLMMLIAVSGDSPREGIGVGGFFVVLGLAFFINALFESQPVSPSDAGRPPAPPLPPPGAVPREGSQPSPGQPPPSGPLP